MQDAIASGRIFAQGPVRRDADDIILCRCQNVILRRGVLIAVVEGVVRHEAVKFLGLRWQNRRLLVNIPPAMSTVSIAFLVRRTLEVAFCLAVLNVIDSL